MSYDGWSYDDVLLDAKGLSITNLAHDGHSLMSKGGILRTYAELKNSKGSTFIHFELGTEGMGVGTNTVSQVTHRQPSGIRSPDYYYTLSSQIEVPFSIPDLGGGTKQNLSGKQYYAFTAPSNTPRHETSGLTSAGRFYPSLNFEVNPRSPDRDDEYIDKLRFDYCFDLDIYGGGRRHMIYNPIAPMFKGISDIKKLILSMINGPVKNTSQAGLFQDWDTNISWRLISTLPGGGKHTFSHAEKPLIWEVVADGIINGRGAHKIPVAGYWDNIHAWGYNSDGLVSTPGMPYGFHLHWHWASSVTDKTSMTLGRWTQPRLGDPELAGRDINNNPIYGGPLIDPRNPKLDLRIAFVKKTTAQEFSRQSAKAHDDFEKIFQKIHTDPEEIKDGDECSVIVSIVIHREDPSKHWEGTVFPHGIFFPHEYDPHWIAKWVLLPVEYAYSEQYITNKPNKRVWKRNPS